MKILHVIRGLANSSGTTHIVGPLAEAQARLGHNVSVYFVSKPNQQAVIPAPDLVESIEFPMTVSSRHYGWSLPFARHLKKDIRRFDVIHIHAIWNFPTWWAMRCSDRAGIPYIVAPQGSLENWALGRGKHSKRLYARVFEKRFFDRAARIQALTVSEARQCREFGIRAPAVVLPNGVDLAAIESTTNAADLRGELNLPPDEQLIIFLSRIFPKKGLDLLAEAFGLVLRDRSDVTLLIAGHDAGTKYLDEVKTMLSRAGALHKTRFLGEVQGRRKFEVLRGSDLFVLPSYSEGLPVAVLEAMAVALPVVITRGCNLPEVQTHNAGWLAEPHVASLYDNLRRAIEAPQEQRLRGTNAAALIRQRFTWDTIAHSSIDMYRSVITESLIARTPMSAQSQVLEAGSSHEQ